MERLIDIKNVLVLKVQMPDLSRNNWKNIRYKKLPRMNFLVLVKRVDLTVDITNELFLNMEYLSASKALDEGITDDIIDIHFSPGIFFILLYSSDKASFCFTPGI